MQRTRHQPFEFDGRDLFQFALAYGVGQTAATIAKSYQFALADYFKLFAIHQLTREVLTGYLLAIELLTTIVVALFLWLPLRRRLGSRSWSEWVLANLAACIAGFILSQLVLQWMFSPTTQSAILNRQIDTAANAMREGIRAVLYASVVAAWLYRVTRLNALPFALMSAASGAIGAAIFATMLNKFGMGIAIAPAFMLVGFGPSNQALGVLLVFGTLLIASLLYESVLGAIQGAGLWLMARLGDRNAQDAARPVEKGKTL